MLHSSTFLLALLAVASIAYSDRSFYVAPGGDNDNDGSIEAPLASIQLALNSADEPGDRVIVREGVYREYLTFPHDGTADKPIEVTAYPGETPVLDASGLTTDRVAQVLIEDREHVILGGFTIRGFRSSVRAAAVFVLGSGDSITLRNLTIHDVRPTQGYEGDMRAVGIYSVGGGLIKNVTVAGCTFKDVMTGYSEVLTITGAVRDFDVRNNTAFHNQTNPVFLAAGLNDAQGNGLLVMPDGSVVDGDPAGPGRFAHNTIYSNTDPNRGGIALYVNGARGIVIEHNTVFANHTGISVMAENPTLVTQDVIVRHNVVHDQHGYGIVVGSGGETGGRLDSGSVRDVQIVHNTLVDNGRSGIWSSGASLEVGSVDDCLIAGNIVVAPERGAGAGVLLRCRAEPIDFRLHSNLWYAPAGRGTFQ